MSNYFSGQIVVLGGRDLEREESAKISIKKEKPDTKSHELDWSFLKKGSKAKRF